MSNKSGTSSQVISLPKGGGAISGMGETFSPDLHTGTGNFSVPINIPTGRNELQPELSLSYSTGNGNSPFGLGWNLSVPGVSRKTSKGVPRYDDESDVFVFSGAEDLVPIFSDSSGKTRYRPRTEGMFARIERQHDASNDYWEVRSKGGLVSQFGTPGLAGSDPATIADPSDRSKVSGWRISETSDPFGNLIRYEYERDSETDGPHHWDQLYLKRILYADYTDNGDTKFLVSLSFVYEDRPDPFSDYRSGFEIRTRRRCSRIEIHTHADQDRLARSYNLTYLDQRQGAEEHLPLNGVSILSQIQIVGHDGGRTEEQPSLEFDYTKFEPERRDFFPLAGEQLPTSDLGESTIEMADLFGNGLPDVLEMKGTVRYWRNLGNGSFDVPREMSNAPGGFELSDPGVQMIDANGDGRIDLLVTTEVSSGYFPLQYGGMWNEGSFQRYDYAPTFNLEDPEVRLVDLDGDGVTDAIRSGSRIECIFNDPQHGWNGIVQRERGALENFPSVNFSDPRVKLSDMNGDGLQDIVMVHDGTVEYWPALGYGNWAKRVTMLNSPRFPYGYDPKRILLNDVDGDGLADIVYVDDTQITLWINQSGNRWSDPILIKGTPAVTDSDAVRLADVMGTGISGVLWSANTDGMSPRANMFFLDLSGPTKPYLLNEVNNNMGAITRMDYAPSTHFYLEDEKQAETRWKTPLPFPVQVVSRVEVIDAISGGKFTTEYSYHHGYWDGAEREFRGFGRVDQRDTEVFERYHEEGLHSGAAFESIDPTQFSPPMETRNWFYQGPVGEEFGDWYEADFSSEYWQGDPQAFQRPAAMTDLLQSLPRRAQRDALRALNGSVLRTEVYALDGSQRENRPYTVSELLTVVREEFPLAQGEPERQHIFFPHPIAQRTTQWERGDDPLSNFIYTDDYDQYGQPRSKTNVAVPRGRDYKVAAQSSEPYLTTQAVTDYAEQGHDLIPNNLVGLEFDGKTLKKTVPMGWANSGASSINRLDAGEDGWIEASTSTLGLGAMLGFSEGSADNHYNTIEYAIYFSQHSSMMVFERGVYKSGFGTISESDVLRVERIGSRIHYKLNGRVVYISDAPSTTALTADMAFYHEGAELVGLRSSKPAYGDQSVNGVQFVEVKGLEFDGPTIRKTAPVGWFNGGAFGLNYLAPGEDGWVEAATSTPGFRSFFGFSEVNGDNSYQTMDYCGYFFLDSIHIFEKGTSKKEVNGITADDVIRVERKGYTISYQLNGEEIYVSETPSETKLHIDLSFTDQGAEITDLTFSKQTDEVYIVDRVARSTEYEIVNDGTLVVSDLLRSTLDGSAERQIIGQEINFYDGDPFQGLPYGQIGSYGVASRTETLVLTEEILQDGYRSGDTVQNPPEMPPYMVNGGATVWTGEYPQEFQNNFPPFAGYIYQTGQGDSPYTSGYFVASKLRGYDHQQNLGRRGRGLVTTIRDPFGHDTNTVYDAYDLLPVEVTDPVGLTTHALYDYRVLKSSEITDSNGNVTAFTYTPMGRLETKAIMGEVGENVGDTLQVPGSLFTYDLLAYVERGQPISVRTTQRVHHVQDTSVPLPERDETIESIEYTDGFGRLIQTRTQGEDITFDDIGLPVDQFASVTNAVGQQYVHGDPPKVTVSGWKVYDNKGRVIERYEPFFSTGWDYAPPTDIQRGRKLALSYDPRGQMVRTIYPDDSEQRVVYGIPADFAEFTGTHRMVNGVNFIGAKGIEFDGKTIRKNVSGTNWGNSGAYSISYLDSAEDGWVEASTSTPGMSSMVGLSESVEGSGYGFIDYAIFFSQHTSAVIYEKGVFKSSSANLTDSDVLRIERAGSTIQYKRNGNVFYTSEVPSETKLHVSVLLYDTGAEMNDIKFSRPEEFAPTPWESYIFDQNDNAGDTHGTGDTSHWNTPDSVILDAVGNSIKTVERNGQNPATDWHTTHSTYDIRGNLTSVTDALERTAFSYIYDLTNDKIRNESIDAGTQRIVIAANGEVVETRDAKGAVTLHSYDEINRPTRIWARDSANQAMTLREYLVYGDSPDSGLTAIDARTKNLLGAIYRHYDESGLLVADSIDFKGNLLEKSRYVISDESVLKAFDPPPANWEVSPFSVDWQPPNGVPLADHATGLLNGIPYQTSQSYDALNRVASARYPEDVDGERKEIEAQFNHAGGLEQIEFDGSPYVKHIAYNARGQRILVAYGNGVMTRTVYDPRTFRILRVRTEHYEVPVGAETTYHPTSPDAPLQDYAYEYDLAGNVVSITDVTKESGILNNPDAALVSDPNLASLVASGDALIRRFTYDPKYRLLSANGRETDFQGAAPPWDNRHHSTDLSQAQGYTEQYQYDALGSIQQLQHQNGGGGFTRQFGIAPDSNRMSDVTMGAATYDYVYDASGNLVQENSSRRFEWDHTNRMKAFYIQAGDSEPSVYAQYLNDAGGQRVKKIVRKQGGIVETTTYIDGLFEHHQIVQGTQTHENNAIHVIDDENRIAMVRIGQPFPDDSTPAVKYHLGDHLGSSNIVLDDTGSLVNREEYSPYGETTFGSFALKRYRFTGKERDEESGLYYHGARYYAPSLTRWVSCDPMGMADGLNLYRYVSNNPMRLTDPTGTQDEDGQNAQPAQGQSTPAEPQGQEQAEPEVKAPTADDVKATWEKKWKKEWVDEVCSEVARKVKDMMNGTGGYGKVVYERRYPGETRKLPRQAALEGDEGVKAALSRARGRPFDQLTDRKVPAKPRMFDYVKVTPDGDFLVIHHGEHPNVTTQEIKIEPGMLIYTAEKAIWLNKKAGTYRWSYRHMAMYGGKGKVYENWINPKRREGPRDLSNTNTRTDSRTQYDITAFGDPIRRDRPTEDDAEFLIVLAVYDPFHDRRASQPVNSNGNGNGGN